MRRSLWVIPLTCILILTAAIQGNVQAQTPQRHFPETGFTVRGAFLAYYEDAPDSLLLFGYPISDEIVGSDGQVYQYFQRARFELAAGPEGPVVRLYPLGEMLYQPGEVAPLNTNSPACRRFQTGFSVCYSFLRFYDANGGAEYFGNPISNVEKHDGRIVQYFENARMEWRANAASDEIVSLTDLGALYLYNYETIRVSSAPTGGFVPEQFPIRLQARAFVSRALIQPQSTQTVFIIAQDQTLNPVENAGVSVSVYFPDGSQLDVRAPDTNASGISQFSFQVGEVAMKEIVRIEAQVTYSGEAAATSTWFRSWW